LVRGLEEEELREVVVARYLGLAPVVAKVLRMFKLLRFPARLQDLGPGNWPGWWPASGTAGRSP